MTWKWSPPVNKDHTFWSRVVFVSRFHCISHSKHFVCAPFSYHCYFKTQISDTCGYSLQIPVVIHFHSLVNVNITTYSFWVVHLLYNDYIYEMWSNMASISLGSLTSTEMGWEVVKESNLKAGAVMSKKNWSIILQSGSTWSTPLEQSQ